jgi:transposase
MEATYVLTAKRQMLLFMQAGMSWQEAAKRTGVQTSRSTAYRWLAAFRLRGDDALRDGRHGHPAKVREPVLKWLEERCRSHPQIASSHLQAELEECFGVTISITHLNRVRAASGLNRQAARREKKRSLCVRHSKV